ncbi:hypothetical protein [Streptomyces yaizuensis]|uniref:DHH family phosphoesterase n=1 Tax=Streptomyces yaizuensis TaxID=2989713 RepID=A0ABQ5NT67_9ACTN|nr:hypothetical protein [Streptomyces sp. YSPA8]GLF93566.1 DHH family phosphoesterase [Streptomyces sp. YSPA8]
MPAPPPPYPRARARGPLRGAPAPAGSVPTGRAGGSTGADPVGELIRWAAAGSLLVPVVLAAFGHPPGEAVVAGLCLAALTAVCRAVLRHAERGAALARARERAAARAPRGPGSGESGRHRRARGSPAPRRTGRDGTGPTPRD